MILMGYKIPFCVVQMLPLIRWSTKIRQAPSRGSCKTPRILGLEFHEHPTPTRRMRPTSPDRLKPGRFFEASIASNHAAGQGRQAAAKGKGHKAIAL